MIVSRSWHDRNADVAAIGFGSRHAYANGASDANLSPFDKRGYAERGKASKFETFNEVGIGQPAAAVIVAKSR